MQNVWLGCRFRLFIIHHSSFFIRIWVALLALCGVASNRQQLKQQRHEDAKAEDKAMFNRITSCTWSSSLSSGLGMIRPPPHVVPSFNR
jgi:hypothetical protein